MKAELPRRAHLQTSRAIHFITTETNAPERSTGRREFTLLLEETSNASTYFPRTSQSQSRAHPTQQASRQPAKTQSPTGSPATNRPSLLVSLKLDTSFNTRPTSKPSNQPPIPSKIEKNTREQHLEDFQVFSFFSSLSCGCTPPFFGGKPPMKTPP